MDLSRLEVVGSLVAHHPGTALNTEIFFKVWDRVFQDKRYLFHEYVVKVDPDTVFLVDRLRVALAFHHDEEGGVYFNNCKFGLHGPIEVFSQKAVDVWQVWAPKMRAPLREALLRAMLVGRGYVHRPMSPESAESEARE